jgi:hypothetical protein
MVDHQPRPRLSFLHNTGRDRSKGHSPDMRCNNLHSRLSRIRLKAREPRESLVSVWFPFRSHSPFGEKQCSSSCSHIRFRRSFTRLHSPRRNVVSRD